MKGPELKLCTCSQLIFDKSAKNTQWRNDSVFSKWCWKNWISACKRMKLDLYTIHRKQLKMEESLTCKTWSCNNLRRKHRRKLHDIGLGNDFLYITPKAQATKGKIDKWDNIKLKSFCSGKKTIKRVKTGKKYGHTVWGWEEEQEKEKREEVGCEKGDVDWSQISLASSLHQ